MGMFINLNGGICSDVVNDYIINLGVIDYYIWILGIRSDISGEVDNMID